jgi:hypothetical protein
MLAASLSRIDPQLKVRIVDKAEDKVQLGHADGEFLRLRFSQMREERVGSLMRFFPACWFAPIGFQVRTVEVFKSLGIAHLVTEEGNEVTGTFSVSFDLRQSGCPMDHRAIPALTSVTLF